MSFEQVHYIIYPRELVLSCTDNVGIQANYLDLNISIENKYFSSKLYNDKRNDFKFDVTNFPCIKYSNIPSKPSFGIYLSQLIRVCRICTLMLMILKLLCKKLP